MGYQPQQFKDFKTGIQEDKQSWLIPDDAQQELNDGYIHHGQILKRDGYRFLATGEQNNAPYCESRIVKAETATMDGNLDGINQIFTDTLNTPVRRGTAVFSTGTPAQTVTDDGEGTMTGDGTGTIDYYTGIVSVTFTTAPTVTQPTVAYDTHPGLPVTMIANYVNSNDVKELIVADTKNINKLDLTNNRFTDITGTAMTGTAKDFFTWVQYPTILDDPRLIFTNNVDQIQSYDGTSVVDWYPVMNATAATTENETGTASVGPYTHTTSNQPVQPTTLVIVADPGGAPQTVTDDGAGGLTGDGSGTINYTSGAISVTFNNVVPAAANNIDFDYSYGTDYVVTALIAKDFKDRIVLFRTTETGGVIHPQRIRISGTGQSGDDFTTAAIGAGVIDIPSAYWIMGVVENRDDLIIYTERETWVMKYTGNDIVPFIIDRIDSSRGCGAPFSPISYLNLTKAYSQYGFTITDGYQVQRNDEKIPDFGMEKIDQDNFDACFSGVVDDDNNHILLYPTPGEQVSNQILVNNYDENTFAIFKVPGNCAGQYFTSFDIDWDYTLKYKTWKEFAAAYATWNEIGFSAGSPISVLGGHEGELWRFSASDSEDNPLHIWNVTTVSSDPDPLLLEITLDHHNFTTSDSVFFAGVSGATEINNKVAYVTSVVDSNTVRVQFNDDNPVSITAYISGGTISRTIPFEFITKNFNPFSDQGMKVRCGYIYLYVEATQTLSTDLRGNPEQTILDIEVFANDEETPTQVTSLDFSLQASMQNIQGKISYKVWRKVFINQNARMIQFKFSNKQPGTRVKIHAIEPGFKPGGRMI